ncbi:DNA polymerase IV [Colwellia sp. MB3u-70]|uniref:DNA polymerase IV n=1 Tax=unclassified Colwellia TaxID=196834 RepID=UPI0015F4E445|nr:MULTISPECIES: DNA polymerase IV [unclassified Colwellia]MBA6292892.1 DNA polymerase IV [Colwellia sp. MB3u-8]MBA6306473.1 DNA polymerase IV [Colwellia sp. MB3u-70]
MFKDKPPQKKIIHIDMDCFYAAVEMRDNPQWRHVPIAVGGNGPRGVLCTCNYKAREFGVRSAMPNARAKALCPELIIVNGRMSVYQQVSQQISAILHRYTGLIEPLSLDEAYLDVTDSPLFYGSATLIAEQIRRDIYNELNLTASAGIAPNKFLAKIASDENKPNGQCVVTPENVSAFVANLALKKIPGIGPKTSEKLKVFGFESCADVRASSVAKLHTIVGKFAKVLYQRSFGIDDRALETSRIRKSLAIETTLAEDIDSIEQCQTILISLFSKLQLRLAKYADREISKQTVKIKFADFQQTTVDIQSTACLEAVFITLLQKAMTRANNRKVRLIGLSLGFTEQHSHDKQSQLALF